MLFDFIRDNFVSIAIFISILAAFGYANKQGWVDAEQLFKDILSAGPYVIMLCAFSIAVGSLVSLVFSDVIIGKVSVDHAIKNENYAWFLSAGTTGLTFGSLTLAMLSVRDKWDMRLRVALWVLAIGFIAGDVYLDSMAADIWRFGEIVYSGDVLSAPEARAHNVLRGLIGAISLFGEPVSATSIVIFPWMVKVFEKTFRHNRDQKHTQTQAKPKPATQTYRPAMTQNQNYRPVPKPAATVTRTEPTYHPIQKPPAPSGDQDRAIRQAMADIASSSGGNEFVFRD